MTKLAETYLDTIHDAHRRLLDLKYRLEDFAVALRTVGMRDLGDDLAYMASDIGKCVKAVNGAVSLELNERVRASDQAATNMVRAALAGLEARRGAEARMEMGSDED